MQKSLGKYLGLDHWSVTKHMQRLITDEFEETVIGIVNKFHKQLIITDTQIEIVEKIEMAMVTI